MNRSFKWMPEAAAKPNGGASRHRIARGRRSALTSMDLITQGPSAGII